MRWKTALAELASPDSPPAAGVAAALTCATAAALVELTAGLAAERVAAEDGEDAERACAQLGASGRARRGSGCSTSRTRTSRRTRG